MAANNNAKIWQEAVSATKECPGIDVLEKLIDQEPSDPKIAQHVSGCPHCQSEIAMLRHFELSLPSPNEGAAVAWIAAQLERKQKAPAAQAVDAVPFWRSLFRLPYMAAAAALVIAITLGVSFYNSDRSGQPVIGPGNFGTTYRGELHLITTGDLNQPPEQLTWEAVAGAASYSVEISDVANDKIWEGKSTQNSINVPTDLRARMYPGKPLNWKVTATDATGKELASGHGRFRITLKTQNDL